MKLRLKFLLVSVLAGVALLVISTVGYLAVEEQAKKLANASLATVAQSNAQQLDGWLTSKARTAIVTSGTIRQMTKGDELQIDLLKNFKDDPDLLDLYIGLENGKFYDGSGAELPPGYDPRTRDWYKMAKGKEALIYTDAYIDASTKQYIVSVAVAHKNQAGMVTGVVGLDITLDSLVKKIKNIKVEGGGYSYLYDQNGIILAHPDQKMVSKNLKEIPAVKDVVSQLLSAAEGTCTYEFEGVRKMVFFMRIPQTGWTLAVNVPEEYVYREVGALKLKFAGVTLLGILLLMGSLWRISRSITVPVGALTENVKRMAGGDLTVDHIEVCSKDEIGELTEAFNGMIHQLRNLVRSVGTTAEAVAASSEELSASAEQSAHASAQVAETITEVAVGTNRQVEAVSRAEHAISAMSGQMQSMVTNTESVTELAGRTAANAASGNEVVGRAVTQMSRVGESSQKVQEAVSKLAASSDKIEEVVGVIAGIAGQTNLLALNAAIEAARAGEQGRGFAVVAEEVRKLAEQSQQAAKSITEMIRSNHENIANAVEMTSAEVIDVRGGVELVNSAGSTFSDIARLVGQVTEQVQELSQSIRVLSTSSSQVDVSIREIDSVTRDASAQAQTVSAATEEQSASMQEIASSSQALATLASELQQAIGKFRI